MRKMIMVIMVMLIAATAAFANDGFMNVPWGSSELELKNTYGYDFEREVMYNGDVIYAYRGSILGRPSLMMFMFADRELVSGTYYWYLGAPDRTRTIDAVSSKYGEPVSREDYVSIVDVDKLGITEDHVVWIDGTEKVISYGTNDGELMLTYVAYDYALVRDDEDFGSEL